ncbi:MAG: hypothetical protein GX589_10465 [Deltaproteobacteria bacterium]|nr:hypothetical protein [Deltaproteobacteria bacterium]
MNAVFEYLSSLAFLVDYLRSAALGVFYFSAVLVVIILAAGALFFAFKVAAAGWASFREGLSTEPILTTVLTVFLLFFSSGLALTILEPAALSAALKGLVYL